jgi:hypothetical protein
MPRWVSRFQASTTCSVSGAPTAPNQPGGRDRGVTVVVPTGSPCRRSPLGEAGCQIHLHTSHSASTARSSHLPPR